jgi:ribonuclease Z
MIFELTILGSSSALPTSTRFPTAHVLNIHERFFLIDCGEGTQIQLRKANIKFGRINHIFISHLHGDHVFGLFGLLSSFNLLGRKIPLHIYAYRGMSKILDFYRGQFAEECGYPVELHPISERIVQKIYDDRISEVYAFPLKHRIPTFGFLFREKKRALNIKKEMIERFNLTINQIKAIKSGEDLILDNGERIRNNDLTEPAYHTRSYAYCSDTAYYQKNIDLLSGVDLLYHEATFLERDKQLAKITGHSTASQAAKMAQKINAGMLLIGHFSNRYKKIDDFLMESINIFPNSRIANELESITIPLTRINY